jgi:hypothetical protein
MPAWLFDLWNRSDHVPNEQQSPFSTAEHSDRTQTHNLPISPQNVFMSSPDAPPSPKSPTPPVLICSEEIGSLTKRPEKRLVVKLSKERTVNRSLRGLHLFVCENLQPLN